MKIPVQRKVPAVSDWPILLTEYSHHLFEGDGHIFVWGEHRLFIRRILGVCHKCHLGQVHRGFKSGSRFGWKNQVI